MSRLIALAVLSGFFAGQQESLEKLAEKVHAEIHAQRPLEAAKIVAEIERRDPKWEGRRELVYLTTSWFKNEDAQMREHGLALLRLLQRDFPDTALGDEQFREAVLGIVGHSFHTFERLHRPEKQARLISSKTRYANNGPAVHPVSNFTHFRLKDDAVAKAAERLLGPELPDGNPLIQAPRESWERIDEMLLVGQEDVTFDFSRPGIHIIEEEFSGVRSASLIKVSSFDVLIKRAGLSLLAWAADLTTGKPVAGVTVRARTGETIRELKTGDDGLVRLETAQVGGIVAVQGSEIHYFIVGDEFEESTPRVYVTTDRPIYRPGQTVRFKAIRRDPAKGRLVRPARTPVRVEVHDPEGRTVHEVESPWNEAGSVSGSFSLGDEPRLGDYSIVIQTPPPPGVAREAHPWRRSFTVSEYRKPEMQVRIELPEGLPVLGGKVKARIVAEYYFGGPVVGAQVQWKAMRRASDPFMLRQERWRDDPRMEFYRWQNVDEIAPPSDGFDWTEDAGSGEAQTGANGTVEIEFVAAKPENYKGGAVGFQIFAEVTDLSRYSAVGSETFEIDSSNLRVRVVPLSRYANTGSPFQARVRVTDRDGRPAPACEVELTAFSAPESNEKEVEFESFFKGSAPSDRDGQAYFTLTPDQAGRLRFRARVRDDKGRVAEDRTELVIAGEPGDESQDPVLVVTPERPVYEAGETAKFLVRLPRKNVTALLTLEGGAIHAARLVHFRNRTETLEIPVLPAHAPNVFVKLVAWKDSVPLSGGHEIGVLPTASFIDVEVRAERDAWRPRERGKVTVTTRVGGKAVAAEVELGIVDEPIFALRPDRAPDIRRFFIRPREDDTLSLASGSFADECTGLFSTGAGGPLTGAVAVAFDEAKGEEACVRRNFPDTMLWLGHVRTGEDGKAEVDVEMPDSLTTWRITARAASGDDRFGSGLSRTLCRKEVMVRLAAPRFFTERDRALVAGIVHNDRRENLEFRVRIEGDLLEVEGGEKKIAVPAGGSARVEWPVKAPKAGAARLRFFADSPGGSDAMEVALPVHPHGVEKIAMRTGPLKGRWESEFVVPPEAIPGSAVLEVSARAAGISMVLDALPGLAGYPYGCVEQTMSKFLPSVVAASALRRLGVSRPALEAELPKMIDAGLRRLYDFQHQDGGWGWWKEDNTDPRMTAYVVYGLVTAKAAGVPIRKDVLDKGLDWLSGRQYAAALYALQAGGRNPDVHVLVENDEDRAWLVLAGRRDEARNFSGKVPESICGNTIKETALVVRALASVDRKDPRLAPLVEWLMLQRRGNSWMSTLDTAHVVYALSELAAAERPAVLRLQINGADATFENGRLRRTELAPGRLSIAVEGAPEALTFCSASLRYRTREDDLREVSGAVEVERRFERVTRKDGEEVVEKLDGRSTVKAGEEIRVVLIVRPKDPLEYVMVECPLPAGAEPRENRPGEWDEENHDWYNRREIRDDRVCVATQLLAREQEFVFRIRPTMCGEFHVMPARAFAMYDPDREGASAEFLLRVVP